ncbi:50S ribosomal protein L24 [Caldiplasma sukawensis]
MYNKVKVSLSRDLRNKFRIRRFPIAKGDIVIVEKGNRKGEGGKVVEVDHRHGMVAIEGINIAKADGKEKSYFIKAEKVTITKLDLDSEERSQKFAQLAQMRNASISMDEIKEYAAAEEPQKEETKETVLSEAENNQEASSENNNEETEEMEEEVKENEDENKEEEL